MHCRQHHAEVPVVALSGGGLQPGNLDGLEVARQMGASAALAKPVAAADLLDTVSGLLETG